MKIRMIYVFLIAMVLLSCNRTPQVVSAGYIGEGEYEKAPAVRALISDHALVTPGGHAYLYMKRGNGDDKPNMDSVAQIRLRVFDADNQLVNEDETRVFVKGSLPLLQDMLRQMVVGDKVRVWGDSYLRVWEIELLGFQNPVSETILASGPVKPPQDSDKQWIITKPNKTPRLQDGQIVHAQIIRWKEQADDSLVFDDSYDILLEVNERVLISYYKLIRNMGVGERARAWHLNKSDPRDLVYDIWIIDRYPQYESPDELHVPKNDASVECPITGYSKRLVSRPENAQPVVDKWGRIRLFEISANCWNSNTGGWVATSDMSALGWSQGVSTNFRTDEFMYAWCRLLDIDRNDTGDYFDNPCKHKADYEAYMRELDEKKAGKPSQVVTNKRRPRGFAYSEHDLTEPWRKIMEDAYYGDVFMLWRHHASMFRMSDPPSRRNWHKSLQYARDMDVVCRIEIGVEPPDPYAEQE